MRRLRGASPELAPSFRRDPAGAVDGETGRHPAGADRETLRAPLQDPQDDPLPGAHSGQEGATNETMPLSAAGVSTGTIWNHWKQHGDHQCPGLLCPGRTDGTWAKPQGAPPNRGTAPPTAPRSEGSPGQDAGETPRARRRQGWAAGTVRPRDAGGPGERLGAGKGARRTGWGAGRGHSDALETGSTGGAEGYVGSPRPLARLPGSRAPETQGPDPPACGSATVSTRRPLRLTQDAEHKRGLTPRSHSLTHGGVSRRLRALACRLQEGGDPAPSMLRLQDLQ